MINFLRIRISHSFSLLFSWRYFQEVCSVAWNHWYLKYGDNESFLYAPEKKTITLVMYRYRNQLFFLNFVHINFFFKFWQIKNRRFIYNMPSYNMKWFWRRGKWLQWYSSFLIVCGQFALLEVKQDLFHWSVRPILEGLVIE